MNHARQHNKRFLTSFIDGKETTLQKESHSFLETLHPITQEVITMAQIATDQEMEEAFASAEKAYKIWKKKTPRERAPFLFRIGQLLREKNRELAMDESLDTGKALQETEVVDILTAADCFEYFASLCATYRNEYYDGPDYFGHVRREPLGICLGIGAWNYPLQIASWKIAPAIAAGNAMVFRPSEMTPRGALNLAKIIHEAGVPQGLVNVLFGDRDLAEKLVKHPKVKKVSLTGSVATGQKVFQMAASEFKSATMELGGKSPLIIFEDANIDEAVKGAMLANFYSSGQVCCNGTRVFVHENIYQDFLSKLKEKTSKMVLGDPLDPKTQMGPLLSWKQAERVLYYIGEGMREGAKLLIGGGEHPFKSDAHLAKAPFISPTVFYDVEDTMKIAREEIFGPVMSVFKFKTKEEVIARANSTAFGLGAGLFTQNFNLAYEVEKELESGFVWINTYNLTPVEFPFGGVKNSGKGRENGWAALESYSQMKSVYVQNGPIPY